MILSGIKIKNYINNTLIPSLQDLIDNLDATSIVYDDKQTGLNATTVQGSIEKMKSLFDNLSFKASNISYNNSTSGIPANNVQTAIDKVKQSVDAVSTNTNKKLKYDDLVITNHFSG